MSRNNSTLGGGGFHHVSIRVRDFDKSVAFYTEVLGFTKKITWKEAPERAIMLDTGDGNYLELFERPDQPRFEGEGAILHLAIRTNSVDDAMTRVRNAGAEVTMEPKNVDIPADIGTVPVRIAFFKGPDGEEIEFFQNEMT